MNLEIEGLKKAKFKSQDCKKLIFEILDTIDPKLTTLEAKGAAMVMITQLGRIYPEDGAMISRMFSFETYRRAMYANMATHKRGKVVTPKNVFANPDTWMEKGCEDCPDKMLRKIEAAVGSQVGAPAEAKLPKGSTGEDEVELPADLFDPGELEGKAKEAAPKELSLVDVDTVAKAKEFLGYGDRPPGDIVGEIKSWFKTNGIQGDMRNKKVDLWIEQWVEELNKKG